MDFDKKTHRGPGIKYWRLIIRNIGFNTKEEDIQEWAGKYGIIKGINLPKCKDPKYPNSCAGFCFIQFNRRADAEKAHKELNFAQLLGRKVAVDWAMDKDRWVTKEQEAKSAIKIETKKEPMDENDIEDVKNVSEIIIKQEPKDMDSDEADGNKSDEEEDDEEEEEEDNKQNIKKIIKQKPEKEIREDKSVCEGRVIFLRNLPFGTTDDQLKEWLDERKLGEIKLAIICRCPRTGDSKGTAFVHFQEKDNADSFLDRLNNEEGMLLDGRKLIGYRALPKSDAKALKQQTIGEEGKKAAKDKRNLYLLRASLIRPGTTQARGMSEEDAKHRERLGELARTKLKNLIMFVSPTRLAIHNIPFSFTDSQLRSICQEALPQQAKKSTAITECRIMHDIKGEDKKGRPIFGKSKGFGFVNFEDHATALHCLQKLNNNPEIFTNERRPIVEFSIENLNALRTKEHRLKMSREEGQNDGGRNRQKDRIIEEKLKKSNDPMAVEKTKRQLMAGGQKWMPKKLGQKIRHKNNSGAVRKRRSSNKDGPKTKRSKKFSTER